MDKPWVVILERVSANVLIKKDSASEQKVSKYEGSNKKQASGDEKELCKGADVTPPRFAA